MPSNIKKLASRVGGAIAGKATSALNLLPSKHFIGEGYRFYKSNKSKGSWLLTAANALFFSTPMYADDAGENLSIEKREERLEGKDIYLEPSKVTLPSDDLFDLAAKKSIVNSSDYETKFLKGLHQNTKIKIREVLAEPGDENLKKSFEDIKAELKAKKDSNIPQESNGFRFRMAELEQAGLDYFNTKHDREKKEITGILKQGNQGLEEKGDVSELSAEQQATLKALETAHAEELKVYQTEMKTCFESARKAQAQAVEKTDFILRIMDIGDNRQKIMLMVHQNRAKNPEQAPAPDPALAKADDLTPQEIAGIDTDELVKAGVSTESGLEITLLEGSVYQINFPNRLFAPGYYFSANNNLETDLKEIFEAAALKYDGNITLTLTGMSPENAQKIARAAFNSMASLGKDPNLLVVKLPSRDKEGNLTMEKREYTHMFPTVPEHHKNARKQRQDHETKHAPTDVNDFKKKMQQIQSPAARVGRDDANALEAKVNNP